MELKAKGSRSPPASLKAVFQSQLPKFGGGLLDIRGNCRCVRGLRQGSQEYISIHASPDGLTAHRDFYATPRSFRNVTTSMPIYMKLEFKTRQFRVDPPFISRNL
jgi:hypothetical protein